MIGIQLKNAECIILEIRTVFPSICSLLCKLHWYIKDFRIVILVLIINIKVDYIKIYS